MEEDETSAGIETVVGGLLMLGIMFVAATLSYSWFLGGSADNKMIAELERLAAGVIEGEDVTVTRLEGYFFVYCQNPNDEKEANHDPIFPCERKIIEREDKDSDIQTYGWCDLRLGNSLERANRELGEKDVPNCRLGSAQVIRYGCDESCLCLFKLPSKPNPNYLTNLVECVELKKEEEGEECVVEDLRLKHKGKEEGVPEQGFWMLPDSCQVGLPGEGGGLHFISHSFRYKMEISKTEAGGGQTGRAINVKEEINLGTTGTQKKFDKAAPEDWDADIIDWWQDESLGENKPLRDVSGRKLSKVGGRSNGIADSCEGIEKSWGGFFG